MEGIRGGEEMQTSAVIKNHQKLACEINKNMQI